MSDSLIGNVDTAFENARQKVLDAFKKDVEDRMVCLIQAQTMKAAELANVDKQIEDFKKELKEVQTLDDVAGFRKVFLKY